jgi:4,5-DOPA dioxygenase extradiol
MPVVFFGHGNPMNALLDNSWSRGWAAIGAGMPRPQGIVSVSAHWYTRETAVTAMPNPPTIHDFGGFPRKLFEQEYPAPGDPALARRVAELLAPLDVGLDDAWGLDHGTWAVLCHAFPEADVPVVQLAIDERQPARFHYELGQRLRPLRDEGVLFMGSGDVVHNLHAYAWGRHPVEPHTWAVAFERKVRELIAGFDHDPLIEYEALGRDALLSVPTPDHYLPLLYVLGVSTKGERVEFPVEGIDGGSVSMLSVRIG